MSVRTEETAARPAQGAPPGRRAPRAPATAARTAQPGRPGGHTRPGAAGAPVRVRPGTRPGRAGSLRTGPAAPPRTRPGSPQRRPNAAAARAARSSRTPFVFLLVGLLGGGLLCLLLINTVLDTGAYQITQLQQENATLTQRTQELQARIAYEESPTVLAGQAQRLGMHEPGLLYFLDLRKGKIDREPAHAPGVSVFPPGYTP